MLDSKYLYDTNISEYADLPYQKVLVIKIFLAKNLLRKLVLDESMENTYRISEVFKAEKFNRNLLKEIGYDDKSISLALKDIETDIEINTKD